MNINLLEFWGQTFLNAARSQKQLENLNKLMGDKNNADNPFVDSIFKAFGMSKPEKVTPGNLASLTQKSTDAYKEFFKSSLNMFEVVSKEDHLKVIKENEELRKKISQQEKILNIYRNMTDKDAFGQEEVVNSLTQIMKSQTQQFQDLVKQTNQYFKKGATTKKK